jgi:hypothetical protein
MARYIFVGQSKPKDGRESEYEEWYLKQHLPAMLQCAGAISVRRFRCADAQLPNVQRSDAYLAIYEIETEAPRSFVEDMLSRAISGRLPTSDSQAPGSSGLIWEELI